jgi:predicted site-specific integrase-resolvase
MYISRQKAAEMLSVSVKTIDRWIRLGKFQAFKASDSSRVLIVEKSISQENLQSPKPTFENNL